MYSFYITIKHTLNRKYKLVFLNLNNNVLWNVVDFNDAQRFWSNVLDAAILMICSSEKGSLISRRNRKKITFKTKAVNTMAL